MLYIIYPFRNRDTIRIEKSLDSLNAQINKDFKVFFVDYGSPYDLAQQVQKLVSKYDFVAYHYIPSSNQLWNKSIALNYIIKNIKEGYCFISDVDMIYHPDFVKIAKTLQNKNQAVYFQVGFLSKQETLKTTIFSQYQVKSVSEPGATGMTLFDVEKLHEINGYDEFYHFWGFEDTDVHERLKNLGVKVHFYDTQILMLHQWHPSYRSKEKNILTGDFQLKNAVRYNYQVLKNVKKNFIIKANLNGWGKTITDSDNIKLQNPQKTVVITNEVNEINAFLYKTLPDQNNEVVSYVLVKDDLEETIHFKIKKWLNRKVSKFFSMKEVNDLLLIHLVSFYRNYPYKINIDVAKQEITFVINK